MSQHDIRLYFQDILDAIEKIRTFVKEMSYEQFAQDERTHDAVVHNLEIIGEAANHIPQEFQQRCPSIPWAQVVGIRNKIAHEYFGVVSSVIWATATEDLGPLKVCIESLMK